MKKLILSCVILLSIGLTACNQNNEDECIIGTWQRNLSDYAHLGLGITDYLIFNEDGTGEFKNIAEGRWGNVYTISDFYWEPKEEGVLLKERIGTIQFDGIENRENPPTIFFDSSNPDVDVVPYEWPYELYRGTLIIPDEIYDQLISFIRVN